MALPSLCGVTDSTRCLAPSCRVPASAREWPRREASQPALASRLSHSSAWRCQSFALRRVLDPSPVSVSAGKGKSLSRKVSIQSTVPQSSQALPAPTPTDSATAQLIEEVRQILAVEHADLPLGVNGRDDVALIYWFLRDRKMDVQETVAKLSKAIRWRHEFGVAQLRDEDVSEEAATGKAYLHQHPDREGRPVIVVVAAKHFPNPERLLASQQLCAFLIERALERLPPGEEKILGIFDLRGFSPFNTDLAFVGFLIDVFFNYYPKRLHQVLFVDAPPIFEPGWRMMRPMLKSYTSLVQFCSAEDVCKKHFVEGLEPPAFL